MLHCTRTVKVSKTGSRQAADAKIGVHARGKKSHIGIALIVRTVG